MHFTNPLIGCTLFLLSRYPLRGEETPMSEQTQAEVFRRTARRWDIRQIGALPVLYPILEALAFQETVNALRPSKAKIDLGRVGLLLTLNRLMAPKPLYKVGRWASETVLPEVLALAVLQLYDQRLGRALDALYPVVGELWSTLAARAVVAEGVDLSVIHWDITSFYFEGEYTDSDLVSFGYSRDKRPDAKQVNLGLDVSSRDKVPVHYGLLAGETADITTPVSNLKALVTLLARPELVDLQVQPIVVTDSKMVTPEAIFACHDYGLYYLGPLPTDNDTKALIRSVSDGELAANELAYRPQRKPPEGRPFIPYRGVLRSITFRAGGRQVVDQALVVWGAGKERLDIRKRRTYLKRLLNGLEHIRKKLNTRRYKKRDYVVERIASVQRGNPAKNVVDVTLSGEDGALSLDFRINRERLAAAQALDGKYVLVTNALHRSAERSRRSLGANEMLTTFKAQDKIEKSVAAVKGPLAVRPVFLHTDERIEVLVFFNMVALLVRAILEMRLKRAGLNYTADRVLEEFAHLEAIHLTFADGTHCREAAALSNFQQRVMPALDLPPVTRYVVDTPLVALA